MLFELGDELIFPHPDYAEDDGLLAYGGDLSIERLLVAYSNGIFPWFNPGDPILWWSPNPRPVFIPGEMRVTKSLKQAIKKKDYDIQFDRNFALVLDKCASTPRGGETGTWLTNDMKEAYFRLHELGVAHSVEVWLKNEIVGGLYGVAIGKAFFGESMFHLKRDASKIAFYYLNMKLSQMGFHFIDGQVVTNHLLSLGAKQVSRTDFLELLQKATNAPGVYDLWSYNFS